MKLDPSDAENFSIRGQINDAMGQAQRAVEDYEQALKLDPRKTALFGNLAKLYEKRGDGNFEAHDYGRAVQDYDAALKLTPGRFANARHGVARTRAVWGQQFDTAITDCTKAIGLQPTQGHFYWTRALVQYRAGNFTASMSGHGDAAFKLNPKSAGALYVRGMSRRKLERRVRRRWWT